MKKYITIALVCIALQSQTILSNQTELHNCMKAILSLIANPSQSDFKNAAEKCTEALKQKKEAETLSTIKKNLGKK